MSYTKEQIASAARLVGISATTALHYNRDTELRWRTESGRDWQPWAETEAGRSDWAVLDTAVRSWAFSMWEGREAPFHIAELLHAMDVTARRPSVINRQQATFAAAVAIGNMRAEQ